MIDLHIHSTYSDGTKTIEEILQLAKEKGLSQIAITDHNTLTGSIAANKLAPQLSIVGCELSVGYLDEEIHLLGYFLNQSDYKQTNFIIKTGEINKAVATAEMVERLNNQGYQIALKELSEFAEGTINRVHICRALMKHNYISSVKEGFEKLIGDHCPAYVKRQYVSIEEAVDAIKKDGGIAIIAHPYNYKHISDIPAFLDANIALVDGVECYHPSANSQQQDFLANYVNSHHKIITGGSDYHGDNKPNIFLNMMEVDDIYQLKR